MNIEAQLGRFRTRAAAPALRGRALAAGKAAWEAGAPSRLRAFWAPARWACAAALLALAAFGSSRLDAGLTRRMLDGRTDPFGRALERRPVQELCEELGLRSPIVGRWASRQPLPIRDASMAGWVRQIEVQMSLSEG